VKTIFLILFLGFSQFVFSQPPYCTLPTTSKSTSLSYVVLSSQGGTTNYRFLYKIIIDCSSGNANSFLDQLHISDLHSNNATKQDWILDSSKKVTAQVDPCVSIPTAPCNTIYYFHSDVTIFALGRTFVAATTNCCRPNNLSNLALGNNFMDYSNPPPPPPVYPGEFPPPKSPGCPALSNGPISNGIIDYLVLPPPTGINSVPTFTSDDSIPNICINEEISHKITAFDPDGDSIAYHFSIPKTYNVLLVQGSPVTNYRLFSDLGFQSGYSEYEPAGPSLTLDPITGLLSGKISAAGTYDIAVSAVEYRAGILLDSTVQDFYFTGYDCSVLPKPQAITLDGFKSCSGFTLTFPDFSTPQYPDVLWNPTTVRWYFGDNDSSSDYTPTHTYADTGAYSVRLIVFPGYHCADTTNTIALVYPFVNSQFSIPDSCSDQSVTFINNSTSSSGKITGTQWQLFSGKNLAFNSTDYNANFNFSVAPKTYHVFLTVTNEKGCVSTDSQYVNIVKSPPPLSFHDTLLSYGATLQLKVDDGNFNQGGQYLWTPVFGLSDPFSPDPVLNSTVDNTYYVTVTNKFGCVMNDSFTVKYYKGPDIYVPNAFTPNNDGKNDVFRPVDIGISTLEYFNVYNRNGMMVFHTKESTHGWDGNTNGRPAPIGTYVWEAKGIDYNGKTIFKKGTVVLIR
jgi:gliding motility-associated-like protein